MDTPLNLAKAEAERLRVLNFKLRQERDRLEKEVAALLDNAKRMSLERMNK